MKKLAIFDRIADIIVVLLLICVAAKIITITFLKFLVIGFGAGVILMCCNSIVKLLKENEEE